MSSPRTTARRRTVWGSHDEGETWGQIGEIDSGTTDVLSLGFSMTRLNDGTLLVPVLVGADRIGDREAAEITPAVCRIYRSQDGGSTWSDYSALGEWSCEVNVAQLPTGRLLAAIRYQRPSLSDDPPDLLERTGALAGPDTHSRTSMYSSPIQTTQALRGRSRDNSPPCWGSATDTALGYRATARWW